MTAGVIMPLNSASLYGPLVMSGGADTPLVTALGVNYNPDGSVDPKGFRNVELLSVPAFHVASTPTKGSSQDLGTSISETLVWSPTHTPRTPQSQCVHYLGHDIHSDEMAQSISPGGIIPAENMLAGNRFIDFSRAIQVDPYTVEEAVALADIVRRMEWCYFNSEMQIPDDDTKKWRTQGIRFGCNKFIDAAGGNLTSDMLMALPTLVAPMVQPVLFIPSAFAPQIRTYTVPATNVGILSEPLLYVSLLTQTVKLAIAPELEGKNCIILMDIAKCRMSFFVTKYTDEQGNQQYNDIIISKKRTDELTGSLRGRVHTWTALNPGNFHAHALIKNVVPVT